MHFKLTKAELKGLRLALYVKYIFIMNTKKHIIVLHDTYKISHYGNTCSRCTILCMEILSNAHCLFALD